VRVSVEILQVYFHTDVLANPWVI